MDRAHDVLESDRTNGSTRPTSPSLEDLFHVPADGAPFVAAGSVSRSSPVESPAPREAADARPAFRRSYYERYGHPLLDLVLLAVALPVALPIGAVIFVINAILFRGVARAFFVQTRVGQHGETFDILKFRTMTPCPRSEGRTHGRSGGAWASSRDAARVTRFGRLLRNTHLDELPQLLNIARGEMSFIGPRPEMLDADRWARANVPGFERQPNRLKPGITGLAQITQGYVGCDVRGYVRKLALNRRYERDISVALDLSIVLRTLLWMVRGRGWRWNAGEALPERGRIHHALRELFASLDGEVPHAILRGAAALDGAEHTDDVDLIVRRRDAKRFDALLREACARGATRIHEYARAGFLRQYHLVARTPSGRHEFLGLDVHTAECCFGVPLLAADYVLRDRARGARTLEPGPSAVVDFVGPLLAGGVVRADYAQRLEHALRDHGGATRRYLTRVFGERAGREVACEVERGRARLLAERTANLRRSALSNAFRRRPLRSAWGLVSFGFSVRVQRLFRPRGRMLAFLGTDGSGKSTLARAVTRELEAAYRGTKPCVIHLRPGLLPQINTLVHLGRTTYDESDCRRPHRARPSGRVGSNLRLLYYWLDYVLGYAARVLPRRRHHALVVFDRYYHDYLVDPLRSRIRHGTGLAKLLLAWVPRPDHVFVCSAAPKLVFERKEELPLTEVARQITEFESLAAERGFDVVRTDRDLDDSVQDVLAAMYGRSA